MKLSYLCIAKLRLRIPFIGYKVPFWHKPTMGKRDTAFFGAYLFKL